MAILGIAPEDDDGNAAVQQPASQGVTRSASPRPTSAATRPATSAVASPDPSSTGNGGAPPEWVARFLARKSYEIDPKATGSWLAWEKFYKTAADAADNLDQLIKLDDDNKLHVADFHKAVEEPVYNRFRACLDMNAKRLVSAPLVDQADAERVFEN
jgi:hypothetical protein